MTTAEINDYSPALKAILQKHKLEPGQTARFRLTQARTELPAKSSEDQVFTIVKTPTWRHLATETIIDPGTGRPLTIGNLKGYRPGLQAGQPMVPNIEEVIFKGENDGIVSVPSTDPVLYERLLLSNFCVDTPNPAKREPASGYRYELIKPDANAKTKYELRVARARAVREVEELKEEDLAPISGALSLPTEELGRQLGPDELRLALVLLAEEAPERVSSVLDAGERKLGKLVREGVGLGLLDFHTDKQSWFWKATQEYITSAVQGYRPEEALVKYIQNDPNGPRFSQMLAGRLISAKAAASKKKTDGQA